MPRTIMLAGAPRGSGSWLEEDLIVNELLPAFVSYVATSDELNVLDASRINFTGSIDRNISVSVDAEPVWRLVSVKDAHLSTGFSQPDWLQPPIEYANYPRKRKANINAENRDADAKPEPESEAEMEISFLTSTSVSQEDDTIIDLRSQSKEDDPEAELSQYLERSFALHDEVPSSQVKPASETPMLHENRLTSVPKQPKQSEENANVKADASSAKTEPATPTQSSTASPKSSKSTSFSSLSSIPSLFNSPTLDSSPTPIRYSRPSTTTVNLPNNVSAMSTKVPTFKTPTKATNNITNKPSISYPNLKTLTNLSQIPTAETIARLEPQTVTVDLIVGIISVSPVRNVTIRRTGRVMELLEVIVGDDTKAGFAVTFWLPSEVSLGTTTGTRMQTRRQTAQQLQQKVNLQAQHQRNGSDEANLRTEVQSLRKGEIVIMKNIALTRFRNVVHGQSLGMRKGLSNSSATRVLRVGAVGCDGGAIDRKIGRVKVWTRDFVGLPFLVDGGGENGGSIAGDDANVETEEAEDHDDRYNRDQPRFQTKAKSDLKRGRGGGKKRRFDDLRRNGGDLPPDESQ